MARRIKIPVDFKSDRGFEMVMVKTIIKFQGFVVSERFRMAPQMMINILNDQIDEARESLDK